MKLAILGGSGRTGLHLIDLALKGGHEVRALVRDPTKVQRSDPKLTVVKGDATPQADVAALVAGTDAVVSALGPAKGAPDVCSRATSAIIAAGVKRYVATSGAGVDVPGDQKDLPGRIISKLVRFASPAVFEDKVRELSLLQNSQVAWTLLRPPRLVDKGAGFRTDLKNSPGPKVSRQALASFLLSCATEGRHVREAPFIAQ